LVDQTSVGEMVLDQKLGHHAKAEGLAKPFLYLRLTLADNL